MHQTVYSGVITWLEGLWFGDSGSDMDKGEKMIDQIQEMEPTSLPASFLPKLTTACF